MPRTSSATLRAGIERLIVNSPYQELAQCWHYQGKSRLLALV